MESNITEPNKIGCKIFSLQDLLTVFSSKEARCKSPDVEFRESIEFHEEVTNININGSNFYFLTQWSKLWNYLSTKNMYAVASNCQLFHFAIEIIFRSSVYSSFLLVLVCVALYYTISQLLLIRIFFPGTNSFPAIILLVLLAVSIMTAHVIRGSLFDGNSATQFVHEQRNDETLYENSDSNLLVGYMSDVSRSNIFVVFAQFLKHLLCFGNYNEQTNQTRRSPTWRNFKEISDLDGYYNLLELGTRYIDINDPNRSSAKRLFRPVENVLRSIFVILPALAIYAFVQRIVYFLRCYHDYDDENKWCEAFLWETYLSGFWLIPLFVETGLYLIIAIGLVSLWYGSIIAHDLSDNWIVRYASLRRVSASNEGNIESLHYNHLIDIIISPLSF